MNSNEWAQLRELRSLQERMNRFFDDARGRDSSTGEDEWAQESEWFPVTDIYEQAQEIVLKMELPEVDQRDVVVRVDGNRLVVSGERRMDPEVKRESYHRRERSYGRFVRTFSLPETVNLERIEAVCRNGVLRVSLPRRSEKEARSINIEGRE